MTSTVGLGPLEVNALRKDFPLLQQESHGKRLVYLDSASSSQRPRAVLDAMDHYYETTHANVHRGVYAIAEEATRQFEAARWAAGSFVNAPRPATEIVFTKNATEALNLVAHAYGRHLLPAGKAILLTELEHHANLVPWLMLAEERGVELRYLPVGEDYLLDYSELDRLIDGVGLVGISCMSNVLGTINDLGPVVEAAHAAGAVVVADGSQLVPHRTVDVRALGVDFLAYTSHKMVGPTGIGVLWGREELLEAMPPFLGGGEMIRDVRLDGFVPNDLPWKFEAGTPPIAEAIGLHAAISYLESVGIEAIAAHETGLTALRDRAANRAARRRPPHLRPASRPGRPWGRALARLPRPSRPRPRPGPRRRGRVRSRRAPLREAAHAPPRGPGDRARLVLPVQQRRRHRGALARARCGRSLLRLRHAN